MIGESVFTALVITFGKQQEKSSYDIIRKNIFAFKVWSYLTVTMNLFLEILLVKLFFMNWGFKVVVILANSNREICVARKKNFCFYRWHYLLQGHWARGDAPHPTQQPVAQQCQALPTVK